ncbi:gamma-glutamyltransferase family protein [Rhizobium johnstonii]|uniref:gamma-glutamyltransferase family protein n=1 Tax=Rhizobium johnstonii TaxID=3019933 RepID=UPI003F9881E3
MTDFSYNARYPTHRVPTFGRNIVATSQPLAAQAGIRMLLRGGNAVDAALAAAITLTVVEPTGNGLGSDAFAIVWDGKELHGLNASGRSPAGWNPERFAGMAKMPEAGWDSVTVPGAVSSWAALSKRFGKLPFEDLFEPALTYARDGFLVSPTIARLWALGGARLGKQPGFANHFLPCGKAPLPGQLFRNPAIAESLRLIAETKGEAFYHGVLAKKIAASAAAHGGVLTQQDLAEHTIDWCGTISTGFRDVELHEIPPNGQGIAALMALGILEHTDIPDYPVDSAESLHLQIEAMKLAFADVDAYVGDPDHMRLSVADLLSKTYLAQRAAQIDMGQAADPGAGAPTLGGTVYLTAADETGMMVSFIQSNYAGFGSGVVVEGTGIHLQNRGAGFTLDPGHANVVGPRKRPFHTIIPGFVTKNGLPQMSFGVMGGPMQAQGHVQMLLRTQLFGQNPQMASDAPRWRFVAGRKVAVEQGIAEEVLARLTELGHVIVRETPDNSFAFGGAQLIHAMDDGYAGGSDTRKDGAALAF